jgi:CRP-like cAMP-binding protein
MSESVTNSPFATARLARGLPPDLLATLEGLGVETEVAPGTVLVSAGEVSGGFHFIVSGAVEVVAVAGGNESVVARLGPGEAVGELSAFTGEPAIASARAGAAGARVRRVRLEEIEHHPQGRILQQHLVRNLLRTNSERLARTNAGYAEQLQAAQRLLAERRMAVRFLLLVLGLSSVSTLICHWIQVERTVDIYSPAFAWCYLLVLGVPTALLAWHERLPPRFFGLTTQNLGRDLAWSTGIVIGATALLLAVLAATGYPLAERLRPEYIVQYGPLYFLHSAVQEFIGRGVLLGLMLKLFGDNTRSSRVIGNAAMAFMFGMTHLHFGLGAVAITTVFAFGLGAYYLVFRNLTGPILIHGCLGLLAFMVGII